MIKWILLILNLICLSVCAQTPLNAQNAFQVAAKYTSNNTLVIKWHIKPGYYLYKSSLRLQLLQPQNAQLGKVFWPDPDHYKTFNKQQWAVYQDNLYVRAPLNINSQAQYVKLYTEFQGCSAKGYCYPPQKRLMKLDLKQAGQFVTGRDVTHHSLSSQSQSKQQQVASYLSQRNHLLSLSLFFAFGMLLALTPCVLPMVPILSSLVVGQSKHNTTRAFLLSLVYVLAMALTYAIAGVITGKLGASVQASLQTPWVIGMFSALFIALALSLFDFYTLRLPQTLQDKLSQMNHSTQSGTFLGAGVMGSLSALVVSPCVTPPLIGALSYIGQTGDALFGGMALFALGLGMGAPLLLIGTAAGRYLPKAGSWMEMIKSLLGFMLLGMAIWFLGRVLNDHITLLLWSLLTLAAGGYLWYRYRTWLGAILGCLFIVYGLLLSYGLMINKTHPLFPWRYLFSNQFQAKQTLVHVNRVQSMEKLRSLTNQANAQNKPVLMEFYADWCATCHQIQRQIFNNEQLQTILNRFLLARVDLSQHSNKTTRVKKAYQVIAPPVIVFISPEGRELKDLRLIGHISVKQFRQTAQSALDRQP